MNDKNTTQPTKPRFDVYIVDSWTDRDGTEQANWTRIGAAFPHKDGKGFNVELKALPVGGKLTLREADPGKRG